MEPIKHIKILSDGGDTHDLILDNFKAKVFLDDYRIIKSIEELEGLVKTKPFLSDLFYVEMTLNRAKKDDLNKIKLISSKYSHIRLILICNNRDLYKSLDFCKVSFSSYDLSFSYFKRYLYSKLHKSVRLSDEEILKLYNKFKGRYNTIGLVLDRLNSGEDCTKVLKSMKISSDLSYLNFVYMLFLGDKINLDRFKRGNFAISMDTMDKKFYKFLYKYTYGLKYILDYVKKEIKNIEKYYFEVHKGKLNEINMHIYCVENNLSEYNVKTYYDIITHLSYEKFLLIKECIEKTENTQHNIFKSFFYIKNIDKIII